MRRLRSCGRTLRDKDAGVLVRRTRTDAGNVAGFAGLQTCGSVHACPVCSARIAVERAGEVGQAAARHLATGGGLAHMTLTMRHDRGQGLAVLWDGLSKAWDRTRRAAAWADVSEVHGLSLDHDVRRAPVLDARGRVRGQAQPAPSLGYVRVVEVTHGDANGWHVHVHALLFLRSAVADDQVEVIGRRLFDSWRTALVGLGFAAPTEKHGYEIRAVRSADDAKEMGEYFTKATYGNGVTDADTIGIEVAGAVLTKSAKNGNRTPFAILADIVKNGDEDDLNLWHEWEKGSKGRRQMLWSRRLRLHLLGGVERSDEEVAADDGLGAGAEDVGVFTKIGWREVTLRWLEADVLETVERHESLVAGYGAVAQLLQAAGVDPRVWRLPPERAGT